MIGVFDSGLGGLTVLKSLLQKFPSENFLYLGDTARLPYGSKSPETVRKYGEQILRHLSLLKLNSEPLKALVIACNTASCQFPENSWQGIPLFNVIDPGAKSALAATQNKRIGVMATRATVNANAYETALKSLDSSLNVFSQASPLLVPLAEEGWVDDPITNLVVYRYLQPLIQQGIDTLVMGCTHYPILEMSIRRAVGPTVTLIQSGEAIAEDMGLAIPELGKAASGQRQVHLRMTDQSPQSEALARRLLEPFEVDSFEWVDLSREEK